MGKHYRFRLEMALRGTLWLVWAIGIPVGAFAMPYNLPLFIILMFIWAFGGFWGFFIWGPCGNKKLNRIDSIKKARRERQFRQYSLVYREKMGLPPDFSSGFIEETDDEEIDEDYIDDDEYWERYYDIHMRWIEELKERCHYNGGGITGEDTYSHYGLFRDLPLNNFKRWAGDPGFNFEVSRYIDWCEFKKEFPDLPTFEDEEDEEEDDY